MDPLFEVHKLNDKGMRGAHCIADLFDNLLSELDYYLKPGREFAIVKTKLEEACFFAKKSLANDPENQHQENLNSGIGATAGIADNPSRPF